MKKLLSFIMSLVLVTSVLVLTPTQVSAVSISSFTDVSTYLPEYENPLRYIVEEKEILTGTSTTTFNPSAAITRSEVIVALCRVFNVDLSEHSSKSNPFTDVPSDAYYLDHVKWAYYEGIINGTSETQFSPLVPMQRQGICLVFVRFCDLLDIELPIINSQTYRFTDNTSIGSIYKPSVYRMYWAGIISGGDNGNFFPEDSMLRIHFCKMLYNYYDPEIPEKPIMFYDSITADSVELSWITNVGEGYQIRINYGNWHSANSGAYTFNNLSPATTYTLQLRASKAYTKTNLFSDIDTFIITTPYLYSLTVNNYFDGGYKSKYKETTAQSSEFIETAVDNVAARYYELLDLHIDSNVTRFTSALDNCKSAAGLSCDDYCNCGQKHHALFNTSEDEGTYPTISDNFKSSTPTTNARSVNAYFTGHKVITNTNSPLDGDPEYTNRSYRSGRYIYIVKLLEDNIVSGTNRTEREVYTEGVIMHELNHTIGAPDHYHKAIVSVDGKTCLNEFCSDIECCGGNVNSIKYRPDTCIMNISRQSIDSDTIICSGCSSDIIDHLETNNKN